MNELREKINDNLQGLWGGAIDVSTNEDFRLANGQIDENKYLKAKINVLTHFSDAILDAVIAALPEKGAHVYDDSTIDSLKHRASVEGYNYALTAMKDVLQAAKENK